MIKSAEIYKNICSFTAALFVIASSLLVKSAEADPKADSIPPDMKKEWLRNIENEMASGFFPEDEGDAFQKKIFSAPGSQISFGYSVNNAGDVNGDGYDDVIIGAPGYNTDVGRAYIYLGGLSFNTTVDIVITGEASASFFGRSVSTAGDVNGDGFDDVIVGADGYSSNTGRAYIYFGGTAMNNIADVILNGAAALNFFGRFAASAEDVNGDGFDDVIVGAHGYSSYTGRAYIFFGGSVMNNVADVLLTGEAVNNYFGFSVSPAGDVNGDGYSDVITGAYGYSGSTGRAYIYYGGAAMNNTADVIFSGEASSNEFGLTVSSAGDVNGDGYSEVIAGAHKYSSNTGRAYIYHGGAVMNNTADIILTGTSASAEFGECVSDAGDLNGDGYSDVAVAAFNYGIDTGRVYVYFGGIIMNNNADAVMTGESSGSYLGYSVSSAGDINGDGFPDLIAGAVGYNTYSFTGRAYLFDYFMKNEISADNTITGEFSFDTFGRSVSDAGDVNGDGFDDYIIGAGAFNNYTGRAYIYFGGNNSDVIPDVILNGESVNAVFGFSVSSAGDVNGDGYDDVIIGSYGYNSSTGRAYVYYGGSPMNNIPDVYLNGEFTSNYFGIVVSGTGDVNGDGFHDMIVSATGYNNSTGKAYLFFGGTVMDNIADQSFYGENTFDNFGASISGAGDINGDGYSDIIAGADLYNLNTGKVYVYLGGNFISQFPYITINGASSYNNFGCSVSGAGDVNGDGFDDVIAGAFGFSNYAGIAYIFYGGSIMDAFADVYFPEVTGARLGSSVSGAGDVNGDGFADVIIGAPGYNIESGKSYILFGGTYMDNTPDVTMRGDTAYNYFGSSVSGLGDINGDGFPDFISSAPNFAQGKGKAYVYTSSAVNISPNLLFVKDFPNDQGGKVQIKWTRSGIDVRGINRITAYTIFRSFPPSGGNFNWQSISNVNADNLPFYYYLDFTPFDSSSSNNGTYYYRIKAKTNNQNEYWYSDIMYGRSVDNLAPLAVSGFSSFDLAGTVQLRWNRNSEPDMYNYILYRNTVPVIDPQLAIPLSTTTDTTYTDTSPLSGLYYYFILAQDIHNNKSALSVTESPGITVNFTMFIQGSYNPGTNLQTSDTIKTFLRNSASPYSIADSSKVTLSTNGSAVLKFPNAASGSYYISVRHRNSIETWNASGTSMSKGGLYSYNLSGSKTQAFGNNLIQADTSPVRFAIFSGDVNQDGIIDLADVILIYNGAGIFLTGYVVTDLTGNNIVDLNDLLIAYNNSVEFVSVVRP